MKIQSTEFDTEVPAMAEKRSGDESIRIIESLREIRTLVSVGTSAISMPGWQLENILFQVDAKLETLEDDLLFHLNPGDEK